MTDVKQLALEYFGAFASRDIEVVKAKLASTVTLRDWVLNKQGLDEVVAATAEIFAGCNAIKVGVSALYVESNVAIAELEISFDSDEAILVLDVIEFDQSGQIASIRAFKG
jgi:hypothetical protein